MARRSKAPVRKRLNAVAWTLDKAVNI